MTDTDGVLVQKRWAEKVNNAIKPEPAEPKQRESLFYQIRPVDVSTAWTYSGGVWSSSGTFDDGQAVTVYRLEDSDASLSTGRFYVVWRGRWEVVSGGGSLAFRVNSTYNYFEMWVE